MATKNKQMNTKLYGSNEVKYYNVSPEVAKRAMN